MKIKPDKFDLKSLNLKREDKTPDTASVCGDASTLRSDSRNAQPQDKTESIETAGESSDNQAKTNNTVKKTRIWEIDFLRGLCVILMILDHLSKLLGDIFGPVWYGRNIQGNGFGEAFCRFCQTFNDSDARVIIHPIVVFFFFSVSGISCSFSRSNLKRGLQLAFVALVYSAATYGISEFSSTQSVLVTFGVLHCLAACILLYALVKFVCRGNKLAIMCLSAAIVVVVSCLYFLYMPPENTPIFFAVFFPPKYIYGAHSSFYTQGAFSPGDLFTLIPYSAMFFFGVFIAPVLYGKRRSLLPALDRAWHRPVTFVGRHALLFYVLHVLILSLLLALISYLFMSPGNWVLF
jgi:uncharacterized membrane protein